MADETTLEEIAERLRRSPLMHRPMGFLPPTSTTDTALAHLHQVQLEPYPRNKRMDLVIRIALHQCEQGDAMAPIEGLDPLFSDYANDGKFQFDPKGWGRVTYVRKDGGSWWPDRFTLRPTFGPADLESVEAGERRIETLLETHDHQPRFILLFWSKVRRAIESGVRVDYKGEAEFHAHLYQATKNAAGETELWVGALPNTETEQPDRQRRLTIYRNNRTGVVAQLTAPFLANLLYLLESAGAARDGIDFARSYYVRRETERASTLRHRIELLEQELEEAREELAELEGQDQPSPSDGEDEADDAPTGGEDD